MKTLFNPAITLMNRLRYPQKFALIGLLFTIPLVLLLAFFVTNSTDAIAFTRKELTGTSYLRPLRTLYEHVLHQRMLTNAFVAGDSVLDDALRANQALIDADFAALEAIDQHIGQELGTTEQLRAVTARWQLVKQRALSMGARTSDDMYSQLIADIRNLIGQVGDRSNLILDPQLDSYYVMNLLVVKLPEAQDFLAQAHFASQRVVTQNAISDGDRTQLTTLSGLIRANMNRTKHDVTVALDNNALQNLLPEVGKTSQHYINTADSFLNELDTQIIYAHAVGDQVAANMSISTQAIDESFRLWDQSMIGLDELLQARIAQAKQRLAFALGMTLVVLVLVTYVLAAFYMGVMRTVTGLGAAANRMISGNMDGVVALDNRDELGQVVQSFNTIATALISASAYRQAVVDNAVDGIMTVDPHGIVDSFNPAAERMFGYTAAEMIGQPCEVLIPVPYADQYCAVGPGREVIGQRKDGATFPLDLAVGEMQVGDQHRFIAVTHDLTERKRAAEERARMQEQIIQAQTALLAELSTPLIPINDQIVVMPLIGALDSQRSQQVLETLLHGIEQSRARVAILDITGVPMVDTQVASALLHVAQAVRLLGAQMVLTGMRPEVVQTLVGLGTNLGDIVTYSTLQHGIAHAMKQAVASGHR